MHCGGVFKEGEVSGLTEPTEKIHERFAWKFKFGEKFGEIESDGCSDSAASKQGVILAVVWKVGEVPSLLSGEFMEDPCSELSVRNGEFRGAALLLEERL